MSRVTRREIDESNNPCGGKVGGLAGYFGGRHDTQYFDVKNSAYVGEANITNSSAGAVGTVIGYFGTTTSGTDSAFANVYYNGTDARGTEPFPGEDGNWQ